MARKRKAGDGTVRQRKDGRWEGRVVIGYDDNGYPKTKNVLAKTKKECVEKLQKLKEECGGLKPEKVRPEMPFGDWLTYWYENHSKPKIRPTTQETYESRIRLHIIPEIGSIPLNKLTQNDLQLFYGRLKKSGRKRFTDKYGEGLSDRMVRMCHATCRSALENGMDVKTLSAMLGHVSAATTLDIYTHITDDMRLTAAVNIDRGIGKVAPQEDASELGQETAPAQAEKPRMTDFKPYIGRKRRSGTGCVTEINDHLFEGRYSPKWPDGKKHARNVYAHTREECEEKLQALIIEMKTELAELKRQKAEGTLPLQELKKGRKKTKKSK